MTSDVCMLRLLAVIIVSFLVFAATAEDSPKCPLTVPNAITEESAEMLKLWSADTRDNKYPAVPHVFDTTYEYGKKVIGIWDLEAREFRFYPESKDQIICYKYDGRTRKFVEASCYVSNDWRCVRQYPEIAENVCHGVEYMPFLDDFIVSMQSEARDTSGNCRGMALLHWDIQMRKHKNCLRLVRYNNRLRQRAYYPIGEHDGKSKGAAVLHKQDGFTTCEYIEDKEEEYRYELK